jgi:predicted metal-dependent phosphoesterase TrpH
MSMSETLILTGTVRPEQTYTYLNLPFDVPDGVTRIDVTYRYDSAIGSDPQLTGGNTLDIGVFDPRGAQFMSEGFRGWSGSARQGFYIADDSATPGYLPGPIQSGVWHICLGLYKVAEQGCDYQVEIILTRVERSRISTFPTLLPLHAAPRNDIRNDAGWYKGELHCHTVNSDGDSQPEDIIHAAEALGLDFLAITDHNVQTQQIAMRQSNTRLMLIPGLEVTTYKGHWNIRGDGGWVDFRILDEDHMRQAVETAVDRGYLVSCNHPRLYGPEWVYPNIIGFHAIEVWNGPWELFNSIALAYWESKIRDGGRYVAVGGSDAHFLKRDHVATLGTPTTWIYCPGDPSPAALLQGLRSGHAFMSASPIGPELYLQSGDAIMGDTISHIDDTPLTFDLQAVNARGSILELIDDAGKTIEFQIENDQWRQSVQIDVSKLRYIRAQLVEDNHSSRAVTALTNPIYIRSQQ